MRPREILFVSLILFLSSSLSAIDAATEVGPLSRDTQPADLQAPADEDGRVEETGSPPEKDIVPAEALVAGARPAAVEADEKGAAEGTSTARNQTQAHAVPVSEESREATAPPVAALGEARAPSASQTAEMPLAAPAVQNSAEAVAAQAAASLATLERLLIAQQDRQMEVFRETNRLITVFGIGFAAVGLAAMLLAAWFQYRGLAAVTNVVAQGKPLQGAQAAPSLLPATSDQTPGMERIQASGERFQGRMSSLERRLAELEDLAAHGPEASDRARMDDSGETAPPIEEAEVEPSHLLSQPVKRTAILLRKAETLIQMGRTEDALRVLDEAETGDADAIEINLLRGQAFEKLGRLGDALAAYERAEELDTSNASTLLMKAGLLNRQERFDEALQCYERALQLHRENA